MKGWGILFKRFVENLVMILLWSGWLADGVMDVILAYYDKFCLEFERYSECWSGEILNCYTTNR